MKTGQLFILFVLFINAVLAQDLKVAIEGNATFNNALYSIVEAGNDFNSSIESESSVFISILYSNFWDSKNNPNEKWRINVHKSDLTWHPNLMLETKRTGKGYKPAKRGSPNIHDGDNFQIITNTPTYFFGGKDEIVYIPLDLKISGMSVVMGAQEFETNIVFTVYGD